MAYPFDDMIAKIFLPHFHKHGENSFVFLVNGNISSQAFLSFYKDLDLLRKWKLLKRRI